MAAGAWVFYNRAKFYLMSGMFDLDSNNFRMSLYTSASNVETVTVSAMSQLSGQVAEAYGYSSSGKALTPTWLAGASASEFRFDATAVVWSAVTSAIVNVKYAVIWQNGASAGSRKPLCYSKLSTAAFSVTKGNTLTVTPSANGIFELN